MTRLASKKLGKQLNKANKLCLHFNKYIEYIVHQIKIENQKSEYQNQTQKRN